MHARCRIESAVPKGASGRSRPPLLLAARELPGERSSYGQVARPTITTPVAYAASRRRSLRSTVATTAPPARSATAIRKGIHGQRRTGPHLIHVGRYRRVPAGLGYYW